MRPNSTKLWQEVIAVESFKMVEEGVFDEEGLIKILYDIPGSYSCCSGIRASRDNIADLKAAVPSNKRGVQVIGALILEDTWPTVNFYMEAIQNSAAQ
jgi:5-oxoprolinase (ATP-hydrolysing)